MASAAGSGSIFTTYQRLICTCCRHFSQWMTFGIMNGVSGELCLCRLRTKSMILWIIYEVLRGLAPGSVSDLWTHDTPEQRRLKSSSKANVKPWLNTKRRIWGAYDGKISTGFKKNHIIYTLAFINKHIIYLFPCFSFGSIGQFYPSVTQFLHWFSIKESTISFLFNDRNVSQRYFDRDMVIVTTLYRTTTHISTSIL